MNTVHQSSLLPYLSNSGQGIRLALLCPGRQKENNDGLRFPFDVVDDSSPFSRIVKGVVGIEDDLEIRTVFLLMQKSEYGISPEIGHALNNLSIESTWLESGRYYFDSPGRSRAFYPGRTGGDGGFVFHRFKPLFYCLRHSAYFHPPCPTCGDELELLTDDAILHEKGVPAYSESLRRYLYCANCVGKGSSELYAFERSPEDPEWVKDRFELVRRFAGLKDNMDAPYSFPCKACTGFEGCYSEGADTASGISIFSFYPFHMLVFEAPPLRAGEILPWISGAKEKNRGDLPDRGGRGRDHRQKFWEGSARNNRFFHGDDQRRFLEILHVKLTFLRRVVQKVAGREGAVLYPVSMPALNSIWAWPAEEGSLAPASWNFSIEMIDLIMAPSLLSQTRSLAGSRENHFLASVWFNMLVVNESQSFGRVFPFILKVTDHLEASEDFEQAAEGSLRDARMLSPANIFWDHRPPALPPEWEKIWYRALKTGFSLMAGRLWEKEAPYHRRLLEEIDHLCGDIREVIFPLRPSAPAFKENPENKAISEILLGLADRLGNEIDSRKAVEEPGGSSRNASDTSGDKLGNGQSEDDIFETVLLTSEPDENGDREDKGGGAFAMEPPMIEGETEDQEGITGDTKMRQSRDEGEGADDWDDKGSGTAILQPPVERGGADDRDDKDTDTAILQPSVESGGADDWDDKDSGTSILQPPVEGDGGDGWDDKGTGTLIFHPPGEGEGGGGWDDKGTGTVIFQPPGEGEGGGGWDDKGTGTVILQSPGEGEGAGGWDDKETGTAILQPPGKEEGREENSFGAVIPQSRDKEEGSRGWNDRGGDTVEIPPPDGIAGSAGRDAGAGDTTENQSAGEEAVPGDWDPLTGGTVEIHPPADQENGGGWDPVEGGTVVIHPVGESAGGGGREVKSDDKDEVPPSGVVEGYGGREDEAVDAVGTRSHGESGSAGWDDESGDTAVIRSGGESGSVGWEDDGDDTAVIRPRDESVSGGDWDDEGADTAVIKPHGKGEDAGGWIEESGETAIIHPGGVGATLEREGGAGGNEMPLAPGDREHGENGEPNIPAETGGSKDVGIPGKGEDGKGESVVPDMDDPWFDTDKTVCIPPGRERPGKELEKDSDEDASNDRPGKPGKKG